MVLFGGLGVSTDSDETWLWSNGQWTQAHPATSPSARDSAAMAWDPELSKIVLFGGETDDGAEQNGTWTWDGTTWTKLSPSSRPAQRDSASMTWDPDLGGLVLFGGWGTDSSGGVGFNDTWLFKDNTWSLLQADGASGAPVAREAASMAYSATTDQLVLFGGLKDESEGLDDTWVFGGSSWTKMTVNSAPPARYGAATAYDPGLGAIVLFGGVDLMSFASYNDTWAWNGSTWLQAVGISAPDARWGSAIAATDTGQLVLFSGGTLDAFEEDDTWIYDTTVPVLQVAVTGASAGTRAAPLFYTGDAATVTITAQNTGILPITGSSATTVTSALSTALPPLGSLVTWAGSTLTSCAGGTGLCGGIQNLAATVNNMTLAAAPATAVAQFEATVVGSTSGCTTLTVPAVASSIYGGTASASTPINTCGGGLGDENWWSYDSTSLGAGGEADVNVANGNLLVRQTDSTQIVSHGQLGFTLGRAYNSQDNMNQAGPLGAGWQFDLGQAEQNSTGGLGVASLLIPNGQDGTQPLSVTYVDRDGTRDVFALRGVSVNSGLLGALDLGRLLDPSSLLNPSTLPAGIHAASGDVLCVDATYSTPAGVDMSMWRYVGISSPNCSGSSEPGAVTVGWSVERPDRLRYDFDAQGHLLDIVDASGNALDYVYNGSGQLSEVYSAACVPSTTVSSSPVKGPACPSYQLSYGTVSVGSNTYTRIDETDPADRVTTYIVSQGATPELLQVWNPDDPFRAASGALPSITYTYSTASTPCPGSAAGTVTVGALCSATDPDGGTTQFAYTPAPLGPDRVLSVSDRRANASGGSSAGAETVYTYHDSAHYTTADTATPARFGSASPPTGCVGNAACERTRYMSIDSLGRVGEIDQGDAADDYLHQEAYFWDGDAIASCRRPDDTLDNDLCETITRAVPSTDPFTVNGVGVSSVDGVTVADQGVSYLYGDEGQLLRKTAIVSPAGGWNNADADITTYGDHEQFIEAGGVVNTFDDRVDGNGRVVSTTPATASYAAAVNADDPIAYYRLDEASGSTMGDSSPGGSNSGSYGSGVPLSQPGAIPGDDAVDELGGAWTASVASLSGFASGTGTSSAFSIESWVRTTNTGLEQQNCSPCGTNGLMVGRATGGLPFVSLSDSSGGWIYVQATTSVADGNWHQVDVTYDGSGHAAGVAIYVDGQQVATTTISDTLSGAFTTSGAPMMIGDNTEATGPDGTELDEMSLYSTALSPARIAAHYAAASSKVRADATTLYALSDQTEMLPPRGNTTGAASHWGDYLSTYRRDVPAASTPPGSYPLPNQTASSTVCGTAATGNTGLLCETDTPADAGVPAGDCQAPITGIGSHPPTDSGYAYSCTTDSYDQFGQKTSQTSPNANAESPTGAATTYTYYADTGSCTNDPDDCDLSANVSAGGWLKAVTDPAGNFVVDAYDRAGNLARSWDRDATAGLTLSAHWTDAANPPSTAYTETDYANPVTSEAVSVSGTDTEVVRADGTVWGSGANSQGQLGDGTTTASDTPVQATGVTGAVQVAQSGFGSTCYTTVARTGSGAVYAWGAGTTSPTQITGLPPIIALAVGGCHALALDDSGNVWAWGQNTHGQIGNGTTTNVTTPVKVLTGVAAIGAGGSHSLAVKTDGSVWAWGSDAQGQLGDGAATDQHSPQQVPGLTGALAVAGGVASSYVVKADGTVWAFGDTTDGALGLGSTTASYATPQQITTLGPGSTAGPVRQIAPATDGAAALMRDGTVEAWGSDDSGQLGSGTTNSTSPVPVPGLSGQTAITGGSDSYLSATSAGLVTIWGATGAGQLGTGATPATSAPSATAYDIAPFAYPWRYVHGSRDAMGNLSTVTTDSDGDPLVTRPARGTSLDTSAYDTTARYDADNNQLSTLTPMERDGVERTVTSYDPFGNPTISTDPAGNATVTSYDSVNRAIETQTTRSTPANSAGSGCTATASSGGPWPSQQVGHVICQTSTTYDGNDQPITSTDADTQTTTTTYDGIGDKTSQTTPGGDGTYTTLTTEWTYDHDGNLRDTCPPRQFDSAHELDTTSSCTSTGAYSTHLTYDNADQPVTQTVYRVTGPATATAETTSTGYDADGNPVTVTDANGHTTDTSYDLLDRQVSQDVPRSDTVSETTQWRYDPSGNVTAILAPGSRDVGTGVDGALVVDGSTAANSTDGQVHDQSNPYVVPDNAQYSSVTLQNGGWITAANANGLVFTVTGTLSVCSSCGISETGDGYAGGAGGNHRAGSEAGSDAENPASSGGNGGLGGLRALVGGGSAGGGGGHNGPGTVGVDGTGGVAGAGAGLASGTADFTDVGATYLNAAGGGGGGGGQGLLGGVAGNGGNGGGFIHITATTITVNGAIDANGTDGGASPTNDGGGGGGAGGGIWLTANTVSLSDATDLNVAGGAGGTAPHDVDGGAGAPGYIRVDADTATNLPSGVNRSKSADITAYSYDADNRLVDTLTGAQTLNADPAVDDTADAIPDPNGLDNQRTRNIYDADGNIIATLPPQAFTDTASLTHPDTDTATRTDYDLDGRPSASYQPRYSATVSDLGTGNDGGSGINQQASQCPTGTADPITADGLIGYGTGTGVCITRTSYDPDGQISTQWLPSSDGHDNNYLTNTYTDDQLLLTSTGPDPRNNSNRITQDSYLYDGDGRTISVTDADGAQTTSHYTADGLLAETDQQPDTGNGVTHITTYGYNADGQQITSSAPDGQDPTAGTTAADYTTTTTWTSDGYQAAIQAPGLGAGDFDTTSYTYDKVGNPLTVTSPSASASDATNPSGIATVNTYTDDNLLASTSTPISTNSWRSTVYGYTPSGQKASVDIGTCASSHVGNCTPDNAAWNDGGTNYYTYAPDGLNIDQVGKHNDAITTSYDQDGQPTQIADPTAGITITASYYLDGLLRTASDGTDDNTYAYDGAGSVSQRTDQTDTSGFTAGSTLRTSYAYNAAELPTSMTSDAAGSDTTTWSYDAAGLPTGQDDGGTGTGQNITLTYHPDETLATQTVDVSGSTVAKDAYSYDDDGNITALTVSGSAQSYNDTYTYNPATNLTSDTHTAASGDPVTTDYTWDHDSNRLTASIAGTGTTWTYRSDDSIATGQTAGQAAQTFTYNNAGDLTSDGCTSYTYDPFDRTKTATQTSGDGCGSISATTTYSYDGLDRQHSATVTADSDSDADGTTISSYDGLTSTLTGQHGATDPDNTRPDVAYELNPDGGHSALTQDGAASTYLDTDGNDDVATLISASSGTLSCAVDYDPFGDPLNPTTPTGTCTTGAAISSTANAAWYRDQTRDPNTGNYQLGTRTYNPTTNSFTTPDTYRLDTPTQDLSIGTDPLCTALGLMEARAIGIQPRRGRSVGQRRTLLRIPLAGCRRSARAGGSR